ncbi:aminotransferase class V-fold PLP-dependent enzyme [Nonomuraea sediminis]|uniref:aminotransferase class V-fold PLP-dependent enzyme n=1 Tax=Nonomuraea sediminis TaxID=2835864 RepID=UPI00202A9867|nr:aminotransferase class V-fold PLP-dependent enzyme [Nonomuraea sediminis]
MNVQLPEAYLSQFREPSGYLDFARVGPVSRVVEHAIATAFAQCAAGRFGEGAAEATASVAALLEAGEDEVAFVSSTSHGLFAAAAALEGEGTVLVPRGEFPANIHPWLRFQDRGGLRVRWIDAAKVTPDVVAAMLGPEVRALAVSAVDALTGHRRALGELKEVLGPDRLLVVDAIQALGSVPVEAGAADLLACGGQKWLRAGWGAAVLLVRDRVGHRLGNGLGGWPAWPIEQPAEQGAEQPAEQPAGLGAEQSEEQGAASEGARGAGVHIMTNPDYPAVAAFGAAVDLLLAAGVDEVGRAVTDTTQALLETARSGGARILLDDLDPDERGGIFSFELPGVDPARTCAALDRAGLVTTRRGAWIRISPHATTPQENVTRLASALRDAHTP